MTDGTIAGFRESFGLACRMYFNYDLMIGAVRIGAGMPVGFSTSVISCQTAVTASDALSGHSRTRINDLAKALYRRCVDHESRPNGSVPAFRALPVLEIGAFGAQGWPLGAWCDMAWIPESTDRAGLEPAWERKLSGLDSR